jgi:hypothetical protein
MTNDNAKDNEEMVGGRLVEAMLDTLRGAEGATDVQILSAIVVFMLVAISFRAEDEAEAIELAASIGQQLSKQIPWYSGTYDRTRKGT